MQSMRDQLLKAGLVSEEQVTKVEAKEKQKKRKRRKPARPARAPEAPRPDVPRVVEMPEHDRISLSRTIERYRVRGDTRGEVEHYFTLRDGRVRKMFVTKEVSGGLVSGRLAIVENGEIDRHTIVDCAALREIGDINTSIVRFHNSLS